ncbi:hypothetical protein O6H91_02G002400 [Diphasiastrum complanatum]|nr:hypothetical protein O6H91_02G002400 [Diphasiastrum complanatum]
MDTIKVYTLKLFLLSASLIAALCLGFCLARSSEICTPTGFFQAAFLVLLLYCRDDRNSIWSILRSLNYSNVAWTKLQNNIETLERARYRLLLVIEQARTSEICMKNNWIEIRRVTGVFRFAAQHQKICCGQVILPTMKHVLQCLETSIEQMKEQLTLLHEFIQQATFSWGM